MKKILVTGSGGIGGVNFVRALKIFSDKAVQNTMWVIYAFTFIIFGLNIALTYIKGGWFTI